MIPVKNVFHLLAYAFDGLNRDIYRRCGTEKFNNTADLLAEILIIGTSEQIRRGLRMGYAPVTEETSHPRGRMETTKSMGRGRGTRCIVCTYDEFSADILENRIIVTTLGILLSADVDNVRKNRIKDLISILRGIGTLDPHNIRWDTVNVHGSTSYITLMSVCRLTIEGLLPRTSDGKCGMTMFIDDQAMSRLYEKFLRGYYRREHPELHVSSPRIEWDLNSGDDSLLPAMQSDMVLRFQGHTMIIDAKYYGNSMQMHFGKQTVHSANLYQIHTYVKNLAATECNVSGMLLYAATDMKIQPDIDCMIGGNRIMAKTLDLNREFPEIAKTLDDIASMLMDQ